MSEPTTAGEIGDPGDERLAGLAAEGDEGAFETLYHRHRGRVLAVCRGMLGDPHDAEEATQTAMLSAYRALQRGHRPRTVGAWLVTIARNECRDLYGRRPSTVPLTRDVAAPTGGPAEQLEHRERIAELRSDLADLPQGQRTALVLRGLGGMPHAEIARVVGGTEDAARNLVHDARVSLGEFEQGRALDCAEVRGRIEAGDGRALRARRIRAHIRVCDDCREAAAAARRSGLGAFLPAPLVAALRGLLGGGHAAPIAGGAAIASLAAVGALVLPGPWTGEAGQAPDGAAAASSAAAITPARAADASLVAGAPGDAGRAALRTAGARPVPSPGQAPSAPGVVTPGAAVPGSGAPAGTTTGTTAASAATPATAPVTTPRVTTPRVTTPGVTTPAVTTPSVAIPPVTVPPVTVGPVAVGPVTVPQVAIPPVTIPPVTVPPVTVPPVTVPPVTVPPVAVPPVTVPPVTVPQVTVPPVTVQPPVSGGAPITLP